MLNDVTLYGGFAGTETSLDQRDPAINETVLSGDLAGDDDPNVPFSNNEENAYHVVTGASANETAILDGFTVCEGNANGAAPMDSGGGLYVGSGQPTIVGCRFERNRAYYYGGAVANDGGNPKLVRCVFEGNGMSYQGAGGGLCNRNSATATLINCAFYGNGNAASEGGGVWIYDHSHLNFVNCVFSGNTATSSAGIDIYYYSTATLTNCTLTGNVASNEVGGINVRAWSSCTLANCIVWENEALSQYPEIYVAFGSGITVSHCDVRYGCNGVQGGGNLTCDPMTPSGRIRCSWIRTARTARLVRETMTCDYKPSPPVSTPGIMELFRQMNLIWMVTLIQARQFRATLT